MLSKAVRRIRLPWDFRVSDGVLANLALQPKLPHFEVLYFARAISMDSSTAGRAVAEDFCPQVLAQFLQQILRANHF